MGRLVCKTCGNIQNRFFNPPSEEGRCDKCNDNALIQRTDDTVEIIEERFKVYQNETMPIIDHYSGKIIEIDAEKNEEEILKELIQKIKNS